MFGSAPIGFMVSRPRLEPRASFRDLTITDLPTPSGASWHSPLFGAPGAACTPPGFDRAGGNIRSFHGEV